MAQQLTAGVDTFAASAWSGSGFGAGEDLEVGVRTRNIVNALNQGASGSLESLVFNQRAKAVVGSTDDGHLVVDIANSSDARLQVLGDVDLRVEAYSGSKVENTHIGNPRARFRGIGGEFETFSISSGRASLNESSVVDDYYGLGGRGVISYNATAIAGEFEVSRGEHTLKRRADQIDLAGGTLIIDHDDAISSWTGDVLNIRNGTCILRRGWIPTINLVDGVLDLRQLREDASTAIGGTAFNVTGGRIYGTPMAQLSITTKGAIFRNDEGIVEYGGGFQPFGG